ncbi:MAG TPA: carbon-nitrogen hydrolase family protein [Alphaproteobacteria bacterium]|nr:carbon-nitrogen hydrolase family protein [Alphaproteobacteria bacterium]
MTRVRVACVQLNAKADLTQNLDEAERWIRLARADGAEFIATPENTSGMFRNKGALLDAALPEDGHPAIARFSSLARETGAWLLLGSISVKLDNGKLANRSILFAPGGETVARYDKIHMFDADPKDGQAYRESETFQAGDRAVVAETDFGRIGMTICYDVRFAYLYAALGRAGVKFVTVPAAFTVPTGEAHWHVLLRARAIEAGAFVIAPGQTGEHAGGRMTYGHSLIVAPWGEVLADGGQAEGFVAADCDLEQVDKARDMIRALHHAREFALPLPKA